MDSPSNALKTSHGLGNLVPGGFLVLDHVLGGF